jgi:hypothetical protein
LRPGFGELTGRLCEDSGVTVPAAALPFGRDRQVHGYR